MSAREVSLEGGSPWGFRMHGGCDQHQPLRISRVNPGSKAAQQGVREGDLISSINGKSTRELTNGEAHALLRNAGDHLKLGLNQDNGSPKRRIYKSSLNDTTSIESIKKITKKTTNTQIISTEIKKSGTDETKNELGYKNQNGSLKTNSTNQQQNNGEKKFGKIIGTDLSSADYLDYATDSESTSYCGKRMPCGSRNRRSRRNYNRKRFQRSSTPPNDDEIDSKLQEITEEEALPSVNSTVNNEVNNEGPKEQTKELKIDEASVTITTERLCPEELPCLENMSLARTRLMRRNKIEKKTMNTNTQICEITTIRHAVPLEARLDHIPGVGIVESSLASKERSSIENETSTITILEPTEPVEPLPEELAAKVENLPGTEAYLALSIPSKRFDFLEIREITENEADFDSSKSQVQAIVVEAESEVEREEDQEKENGENEGDEVMSAETEQQLRSFIESLNLPSSPTDSRIAASENINATNLIPTGSANSGGRDALRSSSKSVRKRAAAALGLYQSQMSQESNRCLGIIQEESETKSFEEEGEDDQQHIRDFINEEIGKFQRERRDLGSVLRDDQKSFEMENDDSVEEGAVDGAKKVESESAEKTEDNIRLIKNDVKDIKDTKDIDISISDSNENNTHTDKITQDCDINVKEKSEESKVILKQENKVESTSAGGENIENFKSLIESLKESVSNEVESIETKNTNKVTELLGHNIEENKIEGECIISKADDHIKIEKSTDEEENKNTSIENESSVKSENSQNMGKVEIINSIIDNTKVTDASNKNAVSQNIKCGSKISEPEVSLEPENCVEVDTAKVKNNEGNNEADLVEVLINNSKQLHVNDETTNKIFENNDKYNASEDNKNINTKSSNNVNTVSTKTYETNTIQSEIIHTEKKVTFEKNIKFENSEQIKKLDTNADSGEKIKCVDNNTIKQDVMLDNLKSTNENTNIKQNNEQASIKVEHINHHTIKHKNQQNNQTKETIVPTELKNTSTKSISKENLLTGILKETKNVPKSTSHTVTFETTKMNHCIEKIPPPPPIRRRKIMNVHDSYYPPDFPFYSKEAPKFAIFHQRALNNFDMNEPINEAQFVKCLFNILSDHESSRQDVQNLLLHYNIDKLSPNVRNIVDDLMAPTPSLSNTSTSSDGYADLCNDLYEESPLFDYKIGTSHEGSLEIANNMSRFNNEMEYYEKSSNFIFSSIPETLIRKEVVTTSSIPTHVTDKCNSDSTTKKTTENFYEKSVVANSSENLVKASEITKINSQSNESPPHPPRNDARSINLQEQQQQGSSSSTSSLSTVKYNSASFCATDKSLITENPTKDSMNVNFGTMPNEMKLSPHSKRKPLLVNSEKDEQTSAISQMKSPESSEPVSSSQVNDHLYYVPLDQVNLGDDRNYDNEKLRNSGVHLPDSLKNLCIKKILSLSHGDHIIRNMSIPECSISKDDSCAIPESFERINSQTENCEMFKSISETKLEVSSIKDTDLEVTEINHQKSKNWTGVPTKENPKVLVCFSPSQQETDVKTSADNLLDLHKKFINRRGYYHDHSQSVSPPKYFIDITPTEAPKIPDPPPKEPKSSRSIFNIIKQNSNSAKSKIHSFLPHYSRKSKESIKSHDNNQERLRTTRLSDWLFFARRTLPSDKPSHVASGDVLIEHRIGEAKQQQQQQQSECLDKTYNCQSNYDTERQNKCVNGALNDTASDSRIQNTTPTLRKSPISFNSAIINKSYCSGQENTCTSNAVGGGGGRVGIDPWYINPALIIEDKPKVPQRTKKVVTVDKDCIDTRSIFDQMAFTPGAKNVASPEMPRKPDAKEIIQNLKMLQLDMKNQMDKEKRNSIPQEYFEKQIKYIEHLEDQLKELIMEEEQERKVSEKNKARPYSCATESELLKQSLRNNFSQQPDDKNGKPGENVIYRDEWKEKSKKVEGDNSEYESKEGSREMNKEVKSENGFFSKKSCEKIEEKEERSVTIKSTNKSEQQESKLRNFLRDLNDINLAKLSSFSDRSREPNVKDFNNFKERIKCLKTERPVSIAAIPTNGEVFRKQMYDEYLHKVLEREERKNHKIIKISSHSDLPVKKTKKHYEDSLNMVEQEFIEKAKNRLSKFGIELDECEAEGASIGNEQQQFEAKFLVDGREIKDARSLPKHLQEFLKLSASGTEEDGIMEKNDEMIAPTFKALSAKPGVWSPGSEPPKSVRSSSPERGKDGKDEPIPPVWTPSSAGPSPIPERKEFRPVPFESPVLSRKKIGQQQQQQQQQQPTDADTTVPPPWQGENQQKEASQVLSQTIPSRIVNSYSAPTQGLNALSGAPRLPRAQNPTITLLQKAREGHLPKGAAYLDETDHIASNKADDKPLLSPGDAIYTLKKDYESEHEIENVQGRKIVDLAPRKYEGIGPTTRGGIPTVLRSEVKENNQAKWYKQMYDSLHRAPKNDDYITIRYKPHRGSRTGYSGASSGYLSEPEPRSYSERSATLDNRRHRQRNKENDFSTATLPRPTGRVDGHYSPETYHLQPGRIENYVPGNCSIQEKEAKEPPSDLTWVKRKWWDEVMDIFDGWLDENGRLQGRGVIDEEEDFTGAAPKMSQRPSTGSTGPGLSSHLRHSVSRQMAASSRSLRGPLPLGSRLYSGSRARANGEIRRDLELNEEQQRLRQSRLLESLFELAAGGRGGRSSRPRSGSTGDSEMRIIRPLGDWASSLGPAPRGPIIRQPTAPSAALSSSASSSSSVTNSSSNGTSNHVAIAPSSSSLLPFEQSNINSAKSYMTHALKESGYESDSTLVFRRREDASPLSPLEQRIAYKTVQKGGDVPLHGLRKPAPERPKDDTEIEYFTISPSLTRIRAHRKSSYSSTTASPASSTSSMNNSRTPVVSMAPSATKPFQISISKNNKNPLLIKKNVVSDSPCCSKKVPSPPKRKSSRNNRTLKLYTSSTKLSEKSHNHETRHDQCFVAERFANIRHVKEKVNSNIEKHLKNREELLQKQKIVKNSLIKPILLPKQPFSCVAQNCKNLKIERPLTRSCNDPRDILVSRAKSRVSYSASPVSRSSKVVLEKKLLEVGSTGERILSKQSTTNTVRDLRKIDKVSQHVSRVRTANCPTRKDNQKVRRTRKEQEESCRRLSRSTADLIVPVEIRRIVHRQKEIDRQGKNIKTNILSSGTVIKTSTAPLISTLRNSRLKPDDKSLKVTVAITPRGKEILKKPPAKIQQLTISQKNIVSGRVGDPKKRKIKDKVLTNRKIESKQSTSEEFLTIEAPERRNILPMRSKCKINCKNESNKNSERYRINDRMCRSEIVTPTLTVDLLRQHQEATMSDSFFQHLFLRDIFLTSAQTNPIRKSSVLDRARMFQEIGYSDSYKSEPSLKSLNIYLYNKRPVSNSRFRNWDRESMSSRSSSPFGPRSSLSRFNKYDSFLRVDEFTSSSSLRGRSPDLTHECLKERSLSEPPMKSLRDDSDTSTRRSSSPSPVRSPSSRKIQIFHQENSSSANGNLSKKYRARSASEMDYVYDYGQNFGSNISLTRSTSSLVNFPIYREEYQQYILEKLRSRPKSKRYKDLYDFYTSLERIGKLEKTTSTADLRPRLKNEDIIDYERWKQIKKKEKAAEELKELQKKIKLVQKEKDFLYSTRDIDRYKWRGDSSLRCKERSVENIKQQFRKLENEESELEIIKQREIASKKDIYKPLWRGNSVVNVANTMARKAAEKGDFSRSSIQASLQKSLGGSNKFWSSLSIEQVTALKNQLNDIYGNDPINPRKKFKPKRQDSFVSSTSSVSINNEMFSNSQKHYKEDIEMHSKKMKCDTPTDDCEKSSLSVSEYEIIVPNKNRDISPENSLGLHVRCHSMIASDRSRRNEVSNSMKRSGSISRVSSLARSQSDRIPNSSSMSEGEKKRLSLSLGKEMLEKVSKRLSASMIKPRETRGALAAVLAKNIPPKTSTTTVVPTSNKIVTKETSEFILFTQPNEDGSEQEQRIETVTKEEWSENPSTKTEKDGIDQIESTTESSDTSVRTVLHRSNELGDDLLKKVEFYEKIEREKAKELKASRSPCKLSSSQSFADLKELFGESANTKYQHIPLFKLRSRSISPVSKAEQMTPNNSDRERSNSASPDVVASTRRVLRPCSNSCDRDYLRRPRSVSPYRIASPTDYCESSGSLESLWRSGSSPDPEKYWQKYLKLVRDGSVRRLRAKFESLEELSHIDRQKLALIPKRYQSDPELARNLLNKVANTRKNFIKPCEISDVAWLCRKYESPRGRRRRGGISPIPRVPWKLGDLIMPHINVISKTAELKESASRKPENSADHDEETRELKARRTVNRVREIFERNVSPESKTSILGEMFTSVPNVHELRDIAPYLAGRWVAHQYPSRYDNSRSVSSPPDLSRKSKSSEEAPKTSITPPSRKKKFPKSSVVAPPARPRTPVSILKQSSQAIDVFANQSFDPNKHRPRFRYQPPPPSLPCLPSPKMKYKNRSWCPPIPTYTARPTVVTFEGPIAVRPKNAK